jgi:hypothetical protein
MVVFVFFSVAASQMFAGLLTQFKQQSKMAETSIEGVVGLEILRQDIDHAGYGLPWNIIGVADWASLANYNEAISTGGSANPTAFNDGNPASNLPVPANTKRAPRAILSGDNTGINGSDYLVIKSIIIGKSANNFNAGKWQFFHTGTSNNMKTWYTPITEYVCRDDNGNEYPNARTIIISPGTNDSNSKSLIVAGGTYYTGADNYTNLAAFQPPAGSPENRIMYGVDTFNNLRMPFNRADYYIKIPSTGMPQRCAPNTGILYKAILEQNATSSSNQFNELPLLDCVADMQVNFWLDTDGDGAVNWPPSDAISGLTAQRVRDQVKEIRVYIVAQEGQKDTNYDFSSGSAREFLSATEDLDVNSRIVEFANLKDLVGDPDYKFYRWKLYTIVVTPNNLR